MAMTIYKLYGGAEGDSVASLDIQLDGTLETILGLVSASGVDAINEGIEAEVSFLSSNSFSTNDTRGSIAMLQSRSGLLTSGMLNTCVNMAISYLEVPVNAGERIHLHILDIGTLTGRTATFYLYVRDKGVARTMPRRR